MSPDHLEPAPGRTPIRLDARRTAVILRPILERPELLMVALFLDGEVLEVIDDPAEVAAYLWALERLEVDVRPSM